MPRTYPRISRLFHHHPVIVALLLCGTVPAPADTSWNEDGDNSNWSNPDNWFVCGPPNTLPPGGGDGVSFRPQ